MAYTGILLRGDTFPIIYLDPPINREMVVAGEHLGVTTTTGVTYWLNTAALSTIGAITDDQGNFTPGFATSALPITYNGVGYIKNETTHMLINSTYKWNHINLDFISDFAPALSALTTAGITATFTKGVKVVIFNETTREELGIIDTSGGTLTFGVAQTVGDVISGRAVDAEWNNSRKAVATIA